MHVSQVWCDGPFKECAYDTRRHKVQMICLLYYVIPLLTTWSVSICLPARPISFCPPSRLVSVFNLLFLSCCDRSLLTGQAAHQDAGLPILHRALSAGRWATRTRGGHFHHSVLYAHYRSKQSNQDPFQKHGAIHFLHKNLTRLKRAKFTTGSWTWPAMSFRSLNF
jgi:hypothetical protein